MRHARLSREKVDRIRQRESLHHLVEHAERLELVNDKVVVLEKLPAPVDEHGIPRIDIMFDGLLGQMATRAYVWTGAFDLHHMATPKADYTVAYGGVGSEFRSQTQLKVNLSRLMHKLAHDLFEITRPTSETVMKQAILESQQTKDLFAITGERVEDPDEMLRRAHEALSGMAEPRVDMMPSLDVLADMKLDELRRTVASLVRVRSYDEKKLIHPALRPKSMLRQRVA